MILSKKTILIHGGGEIHILNPHEVNCNITTANDNKGFVIILGNGSGYSFLAECFMVAAGLRKNEILYLPVSFIANDEFRNCFNDFYYNIDIVLTNYCEIQMSRKDIVKALQVKVYNKEDVSRSPRINTKYIDSWKTDRRLTVRIYKSTLFISTNRDGFASLSYGADILSGYGDDAKYNEYPPHMHYDWDEGTTKSAGVTLYYWHNGKF